MSVEFLLNDGVARVTLNRPDRLNAVDSSTEAELNRIWLEINADPKVRCVVLTGKGRAFCAGADMKEEGPEGLEYWASIRKHGFGGIAGGKRLAVPLIARVNGFALGGGFEMVLGCDLVIAADTASFGFPEPRVGRLPLDGMAVLPRRIPYSQAMGILLTGRRIAASEALRYGLVNEVVTANELDSAVGKWVEDIVSCAPLSVKAAKQIAQDTMHLSVGEARRSLLPLLLDALRSDDGKEGVRAFLEKRKPEWKGA